MKTGKWFGSNRQPVVNTENAALVSHSLGATANSGERANFEQFKGKKLLLVNTAGNCSFTHPSWPSLNN